MSGPSLDLRLDPEHPTPLYHQIAQAVRWKIGTGALAPGDRLPSLRDAEQRWGVSYHTVRRAYRELAREGFVEPARGDGTRVLESPRRGPGDGADVERFAERVAAEARHRFGASATELGAVLGRLDERSRAPVREVVLVECNDHQCRDLAGQLEARWKVRALPWTLDREGEPPPLPLVGTWFHYAEMRRRWPRRIGDMHFAALRLDPAVVDRVVETIGPRGSRPLLLCERDVGTARQHAADLQAGLPFEVEIATSTVLPDLERAGGDAELLVIAPRLWDEVPEEIRRSPRVVELRHVFEPRDLSALGPALGLTPVHRPGVARPPARPGRAPASRPAGR